MSILKDIFKSEQTVFSFKELVLLAKDVQPQALRSQINYYVRTGALYHIRRGLYAKNAEYDRLELATKIFIPSYISFETVLVSAGIIFQYYKQIFVASYQSREVTCDNQVYVFRTIKPTVLINAEGIVLKNYSIATPERAFLDTLYLHKDYHFDNLQPLHWDTVYQIAPIYQKKALEQRIDAYYKRFNRGE